MKLSNLKKATIGLSLAVLVPLIIAGCSVAQLQAGLEEPSDEVVAAAKQASSGYDQPRSIDSYDRFTVASDGSIAISVYARESDRATANVLLIHGAGSGAWAWEYYFELLPDTYNLYALSWRGHFDSSPIENADSSDYVVDQTAVLNAVRRRNDLRTHLVGHSYGGATTMLQVAEKSADVASLILLAPVVPLDYTLAQRLIVPVMAPMFIKHENDNEGVYGGMFLSVDRMQHYYDRYAGKDYSHEKTGLIAKDGISRNWQERLHAAYQVVIDRGIPVSMIVARYDNVVVPRRQHSTAAKIGIDPIVLESGHYIPLDSEAHHSARLVTGLLAEYSGR